MAAKDMCEKLRRTWRTVHGARGIATFNQIGTSLAKLHIAK